MNSPNETLPAYTVGPDGSIGLDEAGQALLVRYKAMKADVNALDRQWCDAVFARLFHLYRWVEAVTVSAGASWEYDDSGGYYLSGYCRVTAVTLAPNAPWPEEIMDEGSAHPDLAADLLTDALNDDAPDLGLLLLGEDQAGDQTFTFAAEPLLSKFGLTAIGDATTCAIVPPDTRGT